MMFISGIGADRDYVKPGAESILMRPGRVPRWWRYRGKADVGRLCTMRSNRVVIIAGALVIVLSVGIFALRKNMNPSGEVPPTSDEVTLLPHAAAVPPPVAPPPIARSVDASARADAAAVTAAVTAAAAPQSRTTALTESEIMAKISELGSSDPAQTLKLAREGNHRFRHTADAPERASHIVRALLNLDRRAEARAEALKMEQEYPGSRWTDDVHRHMFVNPPTHPAERGYGKTEELE
jgi:hypothetical protein